VVRQAKIVCDRAVGYVRLSKEEEQGNGGLGLDAQRAAIHGEVERRRWRLVGIVEDVGWSGRSLRRPGIERALALLRSDEADFLVSSKLDRVRRRKLDLETLREETRRYGSVGHGRTRQTLPGWQLVPVDLPSFDTTTPAGRLTASIMGSAAQFEREMIAARTKDALAVKRSRGERLGRVPVLSDDVRQRVVRLRKRGLGWWRIAKALNEANVTPGRGGKQWYASTAKRVWQSASYIAERRIAHMTWNRLRPRKVPAI